MENVEVMYVVCVCVCTYIEYSICTTVKYGTGGEEIEETREGGGGEGGKGGEEGGKGGEEGRSISLVGIE